MKTATPTRDMTALRANRTHGFTLIEMLVVIAIIAVVAGLVVGLAGVASSNKKLSRSKVELQKIVTLIDAYKAKLGVYPPDNTNAPGVNSLLYELAGALRDDDQPGNPNYITPFGNIRALDLTNTYGVGGVINATDKNGNVEDTQVKRVLKDLHPDQFATVAGHLSLVVPVDGPNGKPNPWHYLVGEHATNNPSSYDLWVDIIVRDKTNRIGNWKN